jgi:peptidoglycan hydrolase CwlO-like protein
MVRGKKNLVGRTKYRRLVATLALGLVFTLCVPTVSYAATSDEQQLKELKDKQNELESKQKSQKSTLKSLQNEKNKAQKNVNSINSSIKDIQNQVATAQQDVVQTSSDIARLSQELEEAAENEKKQYVTLKAQLAYMYENSLTENMVTILFSSGSISEFVSRTEYAMAIAKYDRDLLTSYQKLQTTIKSKTKDLQQKQKDLASYQESLSAKQTELDAKLKDANADLIKKSEAVDLQSVSVDEIDAQISGYKAEAQAVQARVDAAQAEMARRFLEEQERKRAEGQAEEPVNSSEGNGYSNASELNLLGAIIQAEAGNQGYDGMLAVGSVIMNRVFYHGGNMPNSITEVVYQKGQFEPVSRKMVVRQNGVYVELGMTVLQYYLANPGAVSANARAAAQAVYNGERYHYAGGPMNQLFFMTPAAFSRQTWFDKSRVRDQFTLKDHTFFNVG